MGGKLRATTALAGLSVLFGAGVASAQRVYVEASPPPPPYVVVRPLYAPPHLRLAIGGTAGGFVGTSLDSGFVGGLWGQIGVQINPLVGVYYQAHLMLGGFAQPGGVLLGGFGFNELMVDFTLADVLQLGIGPSIDFISACDQVTCGDFAYFGGDARIAVAFGHWLRGGRARTGFMLGVDIHPTILGSDAAGNTYLATSILVTLGGALY